VIQFLLTTVSRYNQYHLGNFGAYLLPLKMAHLSTFSPEGLSIPLGIGQRGAKCSYFSYLSGLDTFWSWIRRHLISSRNSCQCLCFYSVKGWTFLINLEPQQKSRNQLIILTITRGTSPSDTLSGNITFILSKSRDTIPFYYSIQCCWALGYGVWLFTEAHASHVHKLQGSNIFPHIFAC
jgi:hypothetical protein